MGPSGREVGQVVGQCQAPVPCLCPFHPQGLLISPQDPRDKGPEMPGVTGEGWHREKPLPMAEEWVRGWKAEE